MKFYDKPHWSTKLYDGVWEPGKVKDGFLIPMEILKIKLQRVSRYDIQAGLGLILARSSDTSLFITPKQIL